MSVLMSLHRNVSGQFTHPHPHVSHAEKVEKLEYTCLWNGPSLDLLPHG